jgi:CelD/BcsL family acetyltransferase involved in cellulose biosynthesis
MLEHGYREKHRQFDFSAGDEAYKWLYSTHVRVLRPLGQPRLRLRIAQRTKAEAKKVLARYPKALEAARGLSQKLRSVAAFRR